ncbi:auxin-induced protein 5NG4-like isoform X1 [Zingiber officinale]|uniref:auxin-induced protein 5NG4-like isoform X1 n=1 Tax=Zingiber officinale TaxID=94328 RepID=UPI001C4B8A84|nr:auxin-induced protein 5NG4-like isoform X1 [Zingiber officinale]
MGSQVSEKVKLLVAVLALQFCYAGFHIVSRTALNLGISQIVFPVYRNIIALVLLAPFAYFLEKKDRPPLTISFLFQLFLLALCGITANQGFYLLGLYYLSPTYASAIQNSVPAITFVMAAALRLEQININSRYGVAKVVGTVASIGGATIITLYKGPALLNGKFFLFASSNTILNWTLGCVYILGNCIAWSGWMVLQVPVLKKYPARLSVTTITCFFGLIQFLIIAAFAEKDIERWKVHSGGELFTILYAGLVSSGISFSLQIWCIDRGGPLFVAVFQPVQTVVVAIMAAVILGDELYSGGIIGSSFIVLGLYFVLWGKSEEKKATQVVLKKDLTRHLLDEENSHKEICAVPEIP